MISNRTANSFARVRNHAARHKTPLRTEGAPVFADNNPPLTPAYMRRNVDLIRFTPPTMNKHSLLLAAMACSLSACASPKICTRKIERSDPKAMEMVTSSQQAHGAKAFAKIRDVSVRYDGRWARLGPKFQPVLADTSFRLGSEERLLVQPRVIAQAHAGPAGKKFVLRTPKDVSIGRNGLPSKDEEAKRAAAVVADVYIMFLLGPFYFDRPGFVFAPYGEAVVDNAICDQVLAVLRPGFGFSKEDRVILSIDRATSRLRRVLLTLNGFESTVGAEVDVTFRDYRTIDGVLWPTDFDEYIRSPLNLPAHRWRMLGLDTNRGLKATDFTASGFKARAARPADAVPLK